MSADMDADVTYTMTSQQYVAQIRAAEKRGAVKALRSVAEIAKRSAAEVAVATGTPRAEGVVLALAQVIEEYADQIKSGEVTL